MIYKPAFDYASLVMSWFNEFSIIALAVVILVAGAQVIIQQASGESEILGRESFWIE